MQSIKFSDKDIALMKAIIREEIEALNAKRNWDVDHTEGVVNLKLHLDNIEKMKSDMKDMLRLEYTIDSQIKK